MQNDAYTFRPITDNTPDWARSTVPDINGQVWKPATAQVNPVNIPQTIPSSALTGVPSPLRVPQAPSSSSQLGFQTALTAATAPQPAPVAPTPVNPADKLREETMAAINSYTNPSSGYGAKSLQYQNEAGLQEKQAKLSQFDAQDLALQRQLENYKLEQQRTNPQGLLAPGLNRAISEQERVVSAQRADNAIMKLAVQGDISAANNLVKLRLESEFEPIKQKIAYNKEALSLYNNDLSEKEKIQLQSQTKELEAKQDEQKSFQKILDEAGMNKAPVESINEAAKLFAAGDRASAIATLAQYSEKAKEETKYGGYDETQNKVITSTNDKISKSQTYQKAVNLSGYVDSALANLKNNTGASDIAAINQFQKVVDEGAVTRDQDVQLLQTAQSLKDKLLLKVSKISKGEQLSPELRMEMKQAMESMKQAAIAAVNDDPYIKSQTSQLNRYNINPTDTIIGEIDQKYNNKKQPTGGTKVIKVGGKETTINTDF